MSSTAGGNGHSPANLYVASPTEFASNLDFMSVSDSSISPSTPQTPRLYGRTRPRYPQELGRVPLHRRGTSKTYERLEDLLKEAGYKETRIFTPETDRTGKREDDDDDDATVVEDKRTSVVKDVVGFLAGFIPGVGASVPTADSVGGKVLDPSEASQRRDTKNSLFPSRQPSALSSPLANKVALPPPSRHEQRPHHVSPQSGPQIVIHSTTPHRNQPRGQHHQSHQGPSASHHSVHPHKHPAQYQKPHGLGLSSGPNIHLVPSHTTTGVHSPRPSRATAYLRHMASAPNVVPKRPNSTPAGVSHSPQAKLIASLNEPDSDETLKPRNGVKGGNEQQPPLPTSWLEMVAKAVLFGGAGAHVGGPSGHHVANVDANHHECRASTPRQLRPSRSSLSQVSHKSRYYSHHQHRSKKSPLSTGLSDSTNFTPSTATSSAFLTPGHPPPVPPALFAQLERGRADRCVSEVSLTRVTCRSAPGSRSGSVVRSEGVKMGVERDRRKYVDVEWGVEMEREREDRGRNRGVKRRGGAGGRWSKREGKDKEKSGVPSLARMYVEGDAWSSNLRTRKRGRPESGSAVGFAKGKAGHASEGEDDSYSESEEDEEGELNLARMLLPPKRQNSIRSLQKHLLASGGDSGGAHAKLKHVHHPASGGMKGGKVDRHLRRQASHSTSLLSPNDADEEEEGLILSHNARRNNGVLPREGKLKSRNQSLNPSGRRNSCSEDEDVDSFAGLFDVGKRGSGRDPMGSGRSSTSGKRLGIGSVWGVIGGGGS